jgi:hypothetical protein
MRVAIIFCLAALGTPTFACDYPDEGGMPLRRAVTRVQMQAEVDAWAEHMRKSGRLVEYLVKLDEPVREGGKCFWPVEVRVEGKTWRRFLVTPDGKTVKPE